MKNEPSPLATSSKCSMIMEPGSLCPCSLEGVMNIIGKKWSILIVSTLGSHKRLRYNKIQEKLGISPKTLTARLRELESIGLLGRESFNEIPPRVEYFLTEEGKRMFDSLIPMIKWAIEKDHK